MAPALKQKLDNLKKDIPKRGIGRTLFLILLIMIIGFSLQILRFLNRGNGSLFGDQSKTAKAEAACWTPGTTAGTTASSAGTTAGTTVGTTGISTTTGPCTTEGIGTTDTGTTVW